MAFDPSGAREVLDQSQACLDRIHATDRERALARFRQDPESLSSYDRERIVDEWFEYEKNQRATQRREAERASKDQARLAAVTAVLCPPWLQFRNAEIANLNTHCVAIALQHDLNVERCTLDKQAAIKATRTIRTPAISNEETYVGFLHECAHLVDPEADSFQYRYTIDKSVVSPLGEVGAWRWAKQHARRWTVGMHDEMSRCLASYAPSTVNELERDALVGFVMKSASDICDRPKTFGDLDIQIAAIRKATPVTDTLESVFANSLRDSPGT